MLYPVLYDSGTVIKIAQKTSSRAHLYKQNKRNFYFQHTKNKLKMSKIVNILINSILIIRIKTFFYLQVAESILIQGTVHMLTLRIIILLMLTLYALTLHMPTLHKFIFFALTSCSLIIRTFVLNYNTNLKHAYMCENNVLIALQFSSFSLSFNFLSF